jgi:hypothetical protein
VRKTINTRLMVGMTMGLLATMPYQVSADAQADAAAEMARKAQDPLGDVKAIMSDNTIGLKGGPDDDVAYGFSIQPVYSLPEQDGINQILRAVIPLVGVDPGTVIPRLGEEPRPTAGDNFGLSDIILQYFASPKSEGSIKWGFGPQVSLKTRTSDRQAGPGWGGGAAAVVFGGAGNWSIGAIASQHWGEDNFSLFTLQPIVMYNFESSPGTYIGYNNSITYNWNAESDERLTLPLGLIIGKTMLLGNGDGLDLSIGVYDLVERPDNGPESQIKFGISYFFN